MIEYKWERHGDKYYYFDVATGKIVGAVSKIVFSEIWIAVVYKGQYTFTLDDEKHLGQYINLSFAEKAVEFFWDREGRTLLE